MTLMTEAADFFKDPNPKTPHQKALVERAAHLARVREVVTAQAAELIKPSQELARVLRERGVPPDVTVTKKTYDELEMDKPSEIILGTGDVGPKQSIKNRYKIARQHIRAKDEATRRLPYHAHEPDQEFARGWVISEVKTRYDSHTVVLTEAGEIKVGGPLYKPGEKNPAVRPGDQLREIEYEGTVDLKTYPFYEPFNTPNGHVQAQGSVPSLAIHDPERDGDNGPPLVKHTEETYIASNLESIERGLRETGQTLLARLQQ